MGEFFFSALYDRSDSLAHTDPQDGNLASEMLDRISTDSRICSGVSWAWANDQLGWIECRKSLYSDCIVAENGYTGTFKDKVLIDIPGERIEIVNQDHICRIFQRWSCLRLMWRVIYEVECHCEVWEEREEAGLVRVTSKEVTRLKNWSDADCTGIYCTPVKNVGKNLLGGREVAKARRPAVDFHCNP
jgi:hypothetical protein